MELEVTWLGEHGPTVVMVHGSLNDGSVAWLAQVPLAERWRLVIPNRRGYGKSPPTSRVDIAMDAADVAELLGAGSHLVGTSMGGVVAGHAAAIAPDKVLSLTLIEPPAFVNAADVPIVAETGRSMEEHWRTSGGLAPGDFIPGFLTALGIKIALPSPLPPGVIIAARNLMTEEPWACSIPAAEIARAKFPKAVVSGTSCASLEAICDRLAEQMPGSIRRTFPGAGHAVQRIGTAFNEFLEGFLASARS
jgi:pimeloyl-ACP methyl ester carboxylesterase